MNPDVETLLNRYEYLFTEERFFEAHEVAEEIWIANGRQRPSVWLGLVQIAVSYEHKKRGNDYGARKLNERARLNLEFCNNQPVESGSVQKRAIHLMQSVI